MKKTRTKKYDMSEPVDIILNEDGTLDLDSHKYQLLSPLSVSIDTDGINVYQKLSGEWTELPVHTTGNGYNIVHARIKVDGKLGRRLCYVHRLVATVYCDKEDGSDYVDHIDGDRTNNLPENLRWVTARENQLYRRISELKKLKEHNRGVQADAVKQGRYVKLTREDYPEPIYFKTLRDAGDAIGCTGQNISVCYKRGYRPVGWTVEFVRGEDIINDRSNKR